MATDYDTPRKTDEELHEESIEELKAKRAEAQSGQIDVDEEDPENVELPGADLSGEELAVRVVPRQENEFTCSLFDLDLSNKLADRNFGSKPKESFEFFFSSRKVHGEGCGVARAGTPCCRYRQFLM